MSGCTFIVIAAVILLAVVLFLVSVIYMGYPITVL